MSINRKVLAFTGIRSDYDLMSSLYRKIKNDPEMEIGLIVSGAHLSDSYGYTVKNIENDQIPILAKIESLLDTNSLSGRIKSISILLQSCIHTITDYQPDVIIFPGDREDVIVGGLVGAYLGIPTIHFFGGDHAIDGNVDNPVRHATSKLSSLHFVVHECHKQRLLRMGESEERIFIVGNPALDKFIETPIIEKSSVLTEMNKPSWGNYVLVIYHPILGCEESAGQHFEEILIALKSKGLSAFVSYPNVDAGNKLIVEVINKYADDQSFCFYKNLSRELFVNLLRNADFMIGNSSAGLLEAPIIPLGVVNVGQRQKGRLAAGNVIFVEQGLESILEGIEKVISKDFKDNLGKVISIYGTGNSAEKALNLIKSLDLSKYKYKHEDVLL